MYHAEYYYGPHNTHHEDRSEKTRTRIIGTIVGVNKTTVELNELKSILMLLWCQMTKSAIPWKEIVDITKNAPPPLVDEFDGSLG